MQLQTHGGDIYSNTYRLDFSANINPFGMPESVRAAAAEGVEKATHYPDVRCRQLRNAIAEKEQVPAEWILCGNGAAELLFSLAAAKRPKKALLLSPCFSEYEQALSAFGCETVFYELKKEQDFLPDEGILELLDASVQMTVLCSPNNPTGRLIPPELLEKIRCRCQEHQILLVLDECFLEFVDEERQNPQKKHLPEMKELFILKAFTKMYGMPGLRLGYGLCSDTELLESMKRVVQPWNVSLPAQLAGTAACKEQEFAERTRRLIHKEREYLEKQLKELGFPVYPSEANFLFFEAPQELYEVCQKAGILIRDCSNYRGLSKGYYRIAVRSHEENEQFIGELRKYYK